MTCGAVPEVMTLASEEILSASARETPIAADAPRSRTTPSRAWHPSQRSGDSGRRG